MPGFAVENNDTRVSVQGWERAEKFSSFGRLVQKDGSPLVRAYQGEHYRIVEKYRKEFTSNERLMRQVEGVCYLVLTLGFAWALKSVQKLLTATHQNVRIATPLGLANAVPSLLTPAEALSEGLNVPVETCQWIRNNQLALKRKEEIDGVRYFNSQQSHTVFTLDSCPGVIFKLQNNAKERFENSVKAKEICLEYRLDQLVVPKTRLIDGADDPPFIAEELLDFNPTDSGQEQAHRDYAPQLSEPVRQMCILVAKMGLSDIEFRNIPILRQTQDPLGIRQFALADIEETRGSATGLFGNSGLAPRSGLVRLVERAHIPFVEKVARQQGVKKHEYAESYMDEGIRRQERLDRLAQFHHDHPLERFDIQLDQLGIDPEFTQSVSMLLPSPEDPDRWTYQPMDQQIGKLASDMENDFNQQLENKSPDESEAGRRNLFINANHGYFDAFFRSCQIQGDDGQMIGWADHILNRMMEQEMIFSWRSNGHGYFIQA
ncbi:MAG: hypothetical protein S4CHLAM102_05930 [Chlamydiia bacterium]|nr:hypothetical protein [Chlamydiia bacterium]